MAPLSRVVWAMSRGQNKKLPPFLALAHRRHTGTIRPIAAIVFTALLTVGLCAINYNLLVEIFLILRVVNLLCEYAALIKLRYSEPDTPRPFVVPGGIIGAWVLGIPTVIFSGVALYFSDPTVWIVGLVANSAIIIGYFVTLGCGVEIENWKKVRGTTSIQ
jgi:amino acid transporter